MTIDKATLTRLLKDAADGEPEEWMAANGLDPKLMLGFGVKVAQGWLEVMPSLILEDNGDAVSATTALVLTGFQCGWMAAQEQARGGARIENTPPHAGEPEVTADATVE